LHIFKIEEYPAVPLSGTGNALAVAGQIYYIKLYSAMGRFSFISFISPRRRLCPPACKPYGLEAGLEAEPEAGKR
jgi:hypothetical protein